MHGTTVLAVVKNNELVMASDGQVSLGHTVMKHTAQKVKKIGDNVLVGFAGSTADAVTLCELLEQKISRHKDNIEKACAELAKDWRNDKILRKLEAMMIVAQKETILIVSGNGDVIRPDNNVIAIGSGGNYALSAALALYDTEMSAKEIVKKSMKIAGDLCIYTNHNLTIEEMSCL